MSNIHILLDLETCMNDEILADRDAVTSCFLGGLIINIHWSKI